MTRIHTSTPRRGPWKPALLVLALLAGSAQAGLLGSAGGGAGARGGAMMGGALGASGAWQGASPSAGDRLSTSPLRRQGDALATQAGSRAEQIGDRAQGRVEDRAAQASQSAQGGRDRLLSRGDALASDRPAVGSGPQGGADASGQGAAEGSAGADVAMVTGPRQRPALDNGLAPAAAGPARVLDRRPVASEATPAAADGGKEAGAGEGLQGRSGPARHAAASGQASAQPQGQAQLQAQQPARASADDGRRSLPSAQAGVQVEAEAGAQAHAGSTR